LKERLSRSGQSLAFRSLDHDCGGHASRSFNSPRRLL
jgi:hypothetical protein